MFVAAVLAAGMVTFVLGSDRAGAAPPTVSASYNGQAVHVGQVLTTLGRASNGACQHWTGQIAVSAPIDAVAGGADAGVDVRMDQGCQVMVTKLGITPGPAAPTAPTATAALSTAAATCGPSTYSGDVVQLSSGITMAQVTSFQRYYWNCGNNLTSDTTWATCRAFVVTYQISPCQDWFAWFYSTSPSSAESHGQGFVVYSPGFGGGASGWIWVNFEVVASTWRLYSSCGWNNSMGDYFHCGIH